MTLDDLKSGMICETRDGSLFIYVKDYCFQTEDKTYTDIGLFISVSETGILKSHFYDTESYSNDLCSIYSCKLDICKIYISKYINTFGTFYDANKNIQCYKLIWLRNDNNGENNNKEQIKDMTLNDIEKELGYKIRIVN